MTQENAGGALPCARCEQLLQPYLDRELTVDEQVVAARHLEGCPDCAKRYRFEESLRRYVRQCCDEPMPEGLKERLRTLRTPTV